MLSIILGFALLVILATFFFMISTQKKKLHLQTELKEKAETLRRSNKDMENLIRVTSHLTHEPTRKIRNFSTLLLQRPGTSPPREAIHIISKIVNYAGGLLDLAQNSVHYANLVEDSRPTEEPDSISPVPTCRNNRTTTSWRLLW